MTLDEAMRKALEAFLDAATLAVLFDDDGRPTVDLLGSGLDALKAALASLAADGYVLVPKHVPHWAVDWPE